LRLGSERFNKAIDQIDISVHRKGVSAKQDDV